MRHVSQVKFVAVFLSLTVALLAGNRLFAADRAAPAPARFDISHTAVPSPGAAKPCPRPTAATMDKLKDLGGHLGRALDVALDLLSGNEANLLSNNNTALLSGNCPKVRLGDNPKVLSENRIPVLSGNTFSLLSNIKVEIHIDNSGNNTAGSAPVRPVPTRTIPKPPSHVTPPPKR